jgi:hypothetical protein
VSGGAAAFPDHFSPIAPLFDWVAEVAPARDPVSSLDERVEPLWGDRRIEVRWPLAVLAGYTAGR